VRNLSIYRSSFEHLLVSFTVKYPKPDMLHLCFVCRVFSEVIDEFEDLIWFDGSILKWALLDDRAESATGQSETMEADGADSMGNVQDHFVRKLTGKVRAVHGFVILDAHHEHVSWVAQSGVSTSVWSF
jgi:hypothetical protein